MFVRQYTESITSLVGVGKSAAKSYASLGVFTLADLLALSPRAYEDRSSILPVSSISDSGYVNTMVEVISKGFIGGTKKTLKLIVRDISGEGPQARLSLMCFGRNFMDRNTHIGDAFYLYAHVTRFNSELQASSFELKPIRDGENLTDASSSFGRILPIYPLAGNLSQRIIRRDVGAALSRVPKFDNELPDWIYTKYNLVSTDKAVRDWHFPKKMEDVETARRTLAFSELFYMFLESGRKGFKLNNVVPEPSEPAPIEEKLKKSLPFSLTGDQEKAVADIRAALDAPDPMNRLLQGDVGSGKTLVAWFSALHVIAKGRQVAFMAPTELLARQHEQLAHELLEPLGVRIACLTGSSSAKEKNVAKAEISAGNIDLIIGTHALFSEDVVYKNLGLAIIDEQHRFGVAQRKALIEKNSDVDVLAMTATPIPRTLALSLYGEINVDTIRTMPGGRKPVTTFLVTEERRAEMYKTIAAEFKRGHSAFFVYPRIDDSGDSNLRDVTNMYAFLQKIYPLVPSALLHSKVPDAEKIETLNKLRSGEIRYVVATSVIEVGIDIPDATCIVIEHADRFGLAALHQLRGRVGRSSLQAWCFLVFDRNNMTDIAKERLMAMHNSTDGFVLAEKDLQLRGPGDFTGFRQSGFANLHYARLETDIELLKEVRSAVEILASSPGFTSSVLA